MKNFKRIVSMLLICVMMVSALASFGVSAATTEPTLEFVSNNVRYDDNLKLMYAVKATNLPEGATVKVTISDKAGNTYETVADGTVVINGVECYKFISLCGVPAQNIAEVLTATATVEGTDAVATQDYSVLEYLYERLNISTNVSAEQTAFYNALITYAKALDMVVHETATSTIDTLSYIRVNGEGALYTIGEFIELTTDLVPDEGEEIAWFVGETRLTADEVAAGYKVTAAFVNIVATLVEAEVEPEPEPEPAWRLVTDLSQLTVGSQVVIVAKDANYVLSTNQKTSNRGAAAVTKNSDNTLTFGSDAQIITLEAGTVAGTFAFNAGGKYLYAASSSGNQLKSQTSINENASWKVTISANGTASIVAQGGNTRATMQYNPNNGSPLFACYASAFQKPLCIYVYA